MHILAMALLGIVMLISGIFIMRYGLKKVLWNSLQRILQSLTVTPWRGMLVGTIAAALMQSSTAVSLITIGLVSAEYLTFYQALGIILGANIGTCSTVQLMTISFSEQHIVPFMIACGIIALISKRLRYIALALSGLLSMFIGLGILSNALGNISEMDTVVEYLVAAKLNPIYGIIGGVVITLLFQSSSAATGILMLLADEGIVDLVTSTYVVYGNNIGSCLSSIVVAAGAPLAARRVAMAHIILNILGVLAALPFTWQLACAAANLTDDFAVQVAIVHTIFNVISSLAVLPIIRYYAKLIELLVPGRN